MAFQVCCGLQYLHERGISPRDIKPENILQTSDGQYMIGDFGISVARRRKSSSGGSSTALSSSNTMLADDRAIGVGTPLFMAPELTACLSSSSHEEENDSSLVRPLMEDDKKRGEEEKLAAADMWALGVTIMSLAAGRCPIRDPVEFVKNPHEESELARSKFIDTMAKISLSCCSKVCQDGREAWCQCVSELLSLDASARPTASTLRKLSKTLNNKTLCKECALASCCVPSDTVGTTTSSSNTTSGTGTPRRQSLASAQNGGGPLPAAELKRRRETLRVAFESWGSESTMSAYRQIRVFRSDDPEDNYIAHSGGGVEFVDTSALTLKQSYTKR
ncbi:serine-threonine protein kinase, putative [Bodo saltans]|uniref:non-specific serine/threonine protein kinase n=1 Tax=Bodo saltans TaxID=75058 RepID=A0A0S4JYL7_BODSA|nr:serine-threonine protein kinase, putative [Bodo saltans]|eukprot:CUG93693.1 serine-threonine protein kinase, putative [Bodo saltans]